MIVLLEDFKDGICLGTQMSWARNHPDVIAQVQGWIDAGLLVCKGEPKPDPLMDLLFYVGEKTAEQPEEPEGLRPAANTTEPTPAPLPVKTEAELSFPYKRGREARRDGRTEEDCELAGLSRARWLAGYRGQPEPDEVSQETPAASPAVTSPAGTSIVDAIGGEGDLVEALANAHQPINDEYGIEEPGERSTLFEEDDMATATKGKAKGATTKSAKATKGKATEVAVEYRIEDTIVEKPLSWFKQSPFDKRASRPLPWVKELAKSLQQDGQLTPCLARPDGQHIAGWTRVLAAPHAGLKTLKVRIVHCDDLTARRLVLIENAKRRDLSEREQCDAYCELLAAYTAAGKPQKALAADLGIDHTTLSNKTRLKSLPPEAWDRYESDALSIDQMRQIATHAMVPGFADAVIKLLNDREPDRRPGPVCFNDAMSAGFEAAYRPMGKGLIEFRPSAKQKEELGITTVDHPRLGKIEVATNASLWEQLNKEAADKKKQEQTTTTTKPAAAKPDKPTKPEPAAGSVAKHQEEQAAEERRQWVEESWARANATAIRARLEKPKKSDCPSLIRLMILTQQHKSMIEAIQLDDLLADEAIFIEECRACVSRFFSTDAKDDIEEDWQELAPDELERIAAWLNVKPLPHWVPTPELLKTLNSFELLALRDECELAEGVLDGDRAELSRRIMDEWQPGKSCVGWCPKMFTLPVEA